MLIGLIVLIGLIALPTVVSAESTTTAINATVGQQLSLNIVAPFSGTWTLDQGPNSQLYGTMWIGANVPFVVSTSATNGDFLVKSGSGTPLANKLQLNGADVTLFSPQMQPGGIPLNFAQQVVMADPAGSYGTVVTFTIAAT